MILATYKENLQPASLAKIDVLLIPVQGLSSHQENAYPVDCFGALRAALNEASFRGKIFAYINCFIFEPQLHDCCQVLQILSREADGFLLSDFGLMYYLRHELFYQGEIYLITDTSITNSRDIGILLREGFDKVVMARELSLEEYTCIAAKYPDRVILNVAGHQIISTSRRKLLSAYAAEVNKTKVLKSGIVYKMQEEKRQDIFYLFEDDSGCHVFDGKFLNTCKYLPYLLNSGLSSFMLESFALNNDVYEALINLVDSYCHRWFNDNNCYYDFNTENKLQNLYEKLAPILLTDLEKAGQSSYSLWFSKTSEAKEAVDDLARLEEFFGDYFDVYQDLFDENLYCSLPDFDAEQARISKLQDLLAKVSAKHQADPIYGTNSRLCGPFKNFELLAPAGDLARLKTAVIYGADAVFCGGKKFSLRSRASNFVLADILEAVSFAHKHNCRVHVTVNMIPHEDDFLGIEAYLLALKNAGVDAVIVASLSMLESLKKLCPELEAHISTQYSITNSYTVKFYESLEADRVVLARENTLDEVKLLSKSSSLPLEIFIHGGMCVNYSGRCTLSNYMTARDANRGGCAQSCRWRYNLYLDNRLVSDPHILFTMSSKDLSTMEVLPELLKLNIASFKIEGRMKTDFYIASVVSSYRKVIDNLLASDSDKLRPKIINQGIRSLLNAENRKTFSGFYFKHPDKNGQIYGENSVQSNQNFVARVQAVKTVFEDGKNLLCLEIELRNPISKDDYLESLSPSGVSPSFQPSILFNSNNEIQDRLYKAMEACVLYIDTAVFPLKENDFPQNAYIRKTII